MSAENSTTTATAVRVVTAETGVNHIEPPALVVCLIHLLPFPEASDVPSSMPRRGPPAFCSSGMDGRGGHCGPLDGRDTRVKRVEDGILEPLPGQLGEEPLDGVHPGRRGRGGRSDPRNPVRPRTPAGAPCPPRNGAACPAGADPPNRCAPAAVPPSAAGMRHRHWSPPVETRRNRRPDRLEMKEYPRYNPSLPCARVRFVSTH